MFFIEDELSANTKRFDLSKEKSFLANFGFTNKRNALNKAIKRKKESNRRSFPLVFDLWKY
jgi:hypothetical protein